MPELVFRLSPDHDEYILWSTVTDSPASSILTRAQMLEHLNRYTPEFAEGNAKRLDRADINGTSAHGLGDDYDPFGSWNDDELIVSEGTGLDTQATVRRADLREFAYAFADHDIPKMGRLLTPITHDE